ncbi:solute carrier organic anion transporter family member 74D [Drosophila innubila]|uniref:solute carrier organic anion transporter family member 74D n=1 Tax=Drosophila innubila TaxID=198719 RepID=UPI00148D00CE|nr:solute carrier organic anion transporter family member 74D [Drosophila innubila]XP_034472757.1 solute carrier organic anion transporter family member 74D [Drosophila innubila]
MAELRAKNPPPGQYLCGLANWHPPWLQKYATTKSFIAVYGLLGTIQAMSYMYFMVTLTTLEKRFKITSQTTGIVLSGNEISQILLSLILSYIGGQRNRPRWIAWGIAICGLSCYILVLPHFIYGAGDEVLQLTKEYQNSLFNVSTDFNYTLASANALKSQAGQLCGVGSKEENCDSLFNYVPLVLIFCSQFVLGIGNTMYYSLGQTYLDDNTKRTNTPLMLSVAMALRMIGPVFGFIVGFVSLNTFIDPSKTPLIDDKDPRWLGAWWLGWVILGTMMCLLSGLIALFPKQLPKKLDSERHNSHLPHVLRTEELKREEGLFLTSRSSSNATLDHIGAAAQADLPKLKDFPRALMRLLRNKLLMFNIIAGVFFVLSASGFMTFLSKYMEVMFHKSAHKATIIVGPASILGMVVGVITSGLVLTKKKPSVSKVLMWNIFVGFVYICGQITYAFLYCPDSVSMAHVGKFNLSTNCNANCSCEGVSYSPVCHVESDTTYFSACHAGCSSWNPDTKVYDNCTCLTEALTILPKFEERSERLMQGFDTTIRPDLDLDLMTGLPLMGMPDDNLDLSDVPLLNDDYSAEIEAGKDLLSRSKRAVSNLVLEPGVCLKGCSTAFWAFSITSMVINWLGCSGRIGTVLVNYRSVSTEDKSFAQGLALMMLSLFALIPGPIIFGRIIDATCLVWTETCNGIGNCQLHDQTKFRYSVNFVSGLLTLFGIFFDFLVWYYGRDLDLYGDKETKRLQEANRRDQPITPLLAKKAETADRKYSIS